MSATTLLLGVHLLDPRREVDAIGDVLITDGVVKKIDAPGSGALWLEHPDNGALATFVIDQAEHAHELLLTPGLVDIHTHSFGAAGVTRLDEVGTEVGVPIIADAGGAGAATIDDFVSCRTSSAKTLVKNFLSIESGGITETHRAHNMTRSATAMTTSSLDTFLRAIERHESSVVGLKVWASAAAGHRWIDHAANLSEMIGLPMLVHVGELGDPDATAISGEVVDRLQGGDIVTHSFTGQPGALISEEGKILPEVVAARGRGVLFDIAPGEQNLSFDRAEAAMSQGWLPDTISSDAHRWSRERNASMALPHVMGMFLALGLSLNRTIECASSKAADAIGISTGELRVGAPATLSLLARQQTTTIFSDGERSISGSESLIPVGSFLYGAWTEAGAADPDDDADDHRSMEALSEYRAFFAALSGELAYHQLHDSHWRGEELHKLVHRARADCGLDIAGALSALHGALAEEEAPPIAAGWLLEQLGAFETLERLELVLAESSA